MTPFATVLLSGHGLIQGDERRRPPLALPFDGDPYVFRASVGGAPRVLLLHPPRHREPLDRTLYPPLGLARLAAFLRAHGYPVDVVDLDVLALRAPATEAALAVFHAPSPPAETVAAAVERLLALAPPHLLDGAGVVGFDVIDPHEDFQVALVEALLRRLAKTHPATTRVVGGDSAEVQKLALRLARDKAPPVALLADGQGELFLLGLLNRLEFGDRPVRALVNRSLTPSPEGPEGRHQDRAPVVELPRRRLPAPDFRPHPPAPASVALEGYARGPSNLLAAFLAGEGAYPVAPPRVATLPYQMVAGCNAHCVFCNYPRRMDIRPPRVAPREMPGLAEETGVRNFFLLDPTLNITAGYAHRFADELIRLDRGLLWMDSARPVGIDLALAQKLKAAGCVLLTFGVDGGSDALLRLMRKGFSIHDVEESLAATAQAGIVNRFNLIVGFPHETEADVAKTAQFLSRNRERLHILGCYNPFYLNPGIPLEARGVPIQRHDGEASLAGSRTTPYDEIGGRTWAEIVPRVERDFVALLEVVKDLGICPRDLPEHDLFALARLDPTGAAGLAFVRFVAREHGTR